MVVLLLGGTTFLLINKNSHGSNTATGKTSAPANTDTADARKVATQYAALLQQTFRSGQAPSVNDLKVVACADATTQYQKKLDAGASTKSTPEPNFSMTVKDVSTSGNQGRAILTAAGAAGAVAPVDQTFDMVKEAGQWKVCQSSRSSSSPTTTRSG